MKLFLDSADLQEIQAAEAMGFLDGVTMNPKLLTRASRSLEAEDLMPVLDCFSKGPLCLPARGEGAEALVSEARRLSRIHSRVVVKIPLGLEGLRAMQRLRHEGIPTHATLCASVSQALLAAKCGAIFVSPFVGRLEEAGEAGDEIVARILEIYGAQGFETQVMVASVRHPGHVEMAARVGAHACTMPWTVLSALGAHPLTEELQRDYQPAGKSET